MKLYFIMSSPLEDQLPVWDPDPQDDAFVQDPYPAYRDMRASGDIIFWKSYGIPMAVTKDAVAQVMRHPQMGRAVPEWSQPDVPEEIAAFQAVEEHSLLELEPPEHTRIRRVVAKGFALDRMAPLAPKISQIADALISAFPDADGVDLLTAYAQPLTALSIAAFLGVDGSHAPRMQAWSTAMVAMYQARRDAAIEQAAALAAAEFAAFANAELDRRVKAPRDDFLSELVAAEAAGEMSRAELISTVILLLNAGQEATAHAIGNAIRHLIDYPERMLALQPEQIANTVEECLRFTPPLHMFKRHVYQPVQMHGVAFPAGTQVGCLLGSACRDDAVWPDGEKFDPFRMRYNHQAFGVGIHACTGASLARLELQIALPALFSRRPDLKLTQKPRVADRYHFHGLESLMVK